MNDDSDNPQFERVGNLDSAGSVQTFSPFELKVIKIAIHNRQVCSADFSTLFDVLFVCLPADRIGIIFDLFKLVE